MVDAPEDHNGSQSRQPAEGSREVIDRELARKKGGDRPTERTEKSDQPAESGAPNPDRPPI